MWYGMPLNCILKTDLIASLPLYMCVHADDNSWCNIMVPAMQSRSCRLTICPTKGLPLQAGTSAIG